MPIDLIPVISSNIEAIGYAPEAMTLRIKFLSGGLYDYEGVQLEVWQALLGAESKGKFFRSHIKGKYPAYKLEG